MKKNEKLKRGLLGKIAVRGIPLAAVASAVLVPELAWAAGDPLAAVNNLSTFIFALILSLIHI